MRLPAKPGPDRLCALELPPEVAQFYEAMDDLVDFLLNDEPPDFSARAARLEVTADLIESFAFEMAMHFRELAWEVSNWPSSLGTDP